MPPTNSDYRRMHRAFKDLGIEKYQFLEDRYGINSAKQLTNSQLNDLYAYFKNLGWNPTRKKASEKTQRFGNPMKDKVTALWITLAKAEVVKDRSDFALQGFVKRMTDKENLRFCGNSDCDKLIEALKSMGRRHKVDVW